MDFLMVFSDWIYVMTTDWTFPSPDALLTVILLIILIHFLGIFEPDDYPQITLNVESNEVINGIRLRTILEKCPILHERYRPPTLWGKSGHLQTAFYGVLGHKSLKRTFDQRHEVLLSDGSAVTFDVFEPAIEHPSGSDYTLALCPGICNSSESNYIRTCVHNACESGYRCAVLNHLGVLANVPLTTPRIFSYVSTEELETMMTRLMEIYPQTKFISIGFSLGANLTTNFLSTVPEDKLDNFLAGLSVCQGYDAETTVPSLFDWHHGRRIYNFIISDNVKRLLRRNYDKVVVPHIQSGKIDRSKVFSATSMFGIDEFYNRRVQGFNSVKDLYVKCSSSRRIKDIKIPTIFLNTLDDPLFPESSIRLVQRICATHKHHAFIELKYSGHLGFLEGWSFKPNSVTWLDKFILQMVDSVVKAHESQFTLVQS